MLRVIFACLVVTLGCTSLAKSKQLTVEDYAKLPQISLFSVSPSGKRIAYRNTDDKRDMLWITELASNKVLRGVDISDANPNHIHFVDENRIILTASKNSRLLGYKGRHDVSVAFSYNIKTNKLFQMLRAGEGIFSGQANLGSIVGISPDKGYVYMLAWANPLDNSLLKVSIDKRKWPKVHKKGNGDTIDFFVNSDGDVIAREKYDNRRNLHTLEALQKNHWVKIFQVEAETIRIGFDGVTPDAKSLVLRKQDANTGHWAYHTISLQDGSISKPIFERADRSVEAVLTDINRVVQGVRYSGFKPSYEFFDDTLNQRMAGIDAALPDNAMRIVSHTPDWSTILFYLTGTDSAGEYFRYHNGQLHMLAKARKNITTDKVNPVTITEYQARDGLTIPTLLTTPVAKAAKNLPAIMLPHGGPESYDRLNFDWLAQAFANEGYVVIQPQFRGSSGFGLAHTLKGHGEWGRKMQDDLTDAVDFFATKGVIDPNRVCIVGASYGGYAALAGATFTPDVYQCAVSINGVSDVERMLKTDKRQYGSDHWVVAYWEKLLKDGNFDDDHLEAISPINSVKSINIPVLMLHGEHDTVVHPRQSRNMFDEMEAQHKDVKYIELEGGDHYLSVAKKRIAAMNVISGFVNQHLQ